MFKLKVLFVFFFAAFSLFTNTARAEHYGVAVLTATTAIGVTPSGIRDVRIACQQLKSRNDYLGTECLKNASGHLFDSRAVEACTSLKYTNDFITSECLKGIAGRIYSSDEIQSCQDGQDFSLASCMKKAGKSYCK